MASSPLLSSKEVSFYGPPVLGREGQIARGRLPPETQKLGGGKGGRWHFYFGKEARTSCWWWHQVTDDRYMENSPFESEPLKQTRNYKYRENIVISALSFFFLVGGGGGGGACPYVMLSLLSSPLPAIPAPTKNTPPPFRGRD